MRTALSVFTVTISLLSPVAAWAAASDITGLSLGMTPAEVTAVTKKPVANSGSAETVITYSGQQLPVPNSRALAYQAFYPRPDEALYVGYVPGSTGERSGFIYRTQNFSNPKEQPDRDVLIRQLKEKYGEPTISVQLPNGGPSLGWVLSPAGFAAPKTGPKALSMIVNCQFPTITENWLYGMLPRFANGRTPLEECGEKYFGVNIILSGPSSVSGVFTELIDLKAAFAAKATIEANAVAYEKALDAKRKADSANRKPNL